MKGWREPQRVAARGLAALLFASVLLLTASAGWAAGENVCNNRPCIQIGAFNIEWLGTPNFRGCQQGVPNSCWPLRTRNEVSQIADLFTRVLDLDVVTLIEINTSSRQFGWLKEIAASRGYDEFHVGNAQQNVVVMWRRDRVQARGQSRALEVRTSFSLPGNCRSNGLRAPLAVPLKSGNFDFVVVGVHLKSQRGGDCADRVRAEQAKDIVGRLTELRQDDPDIIVIGDFNAELSDTSLRPLFAAGFQSLTQAQLRSPGSGPVSYLKEPFRSVIDHLMVLENTRAEFVPRSTTIFSAPASQTAYEKYLRHISDHAPVWASFYTDRDDD